MDVDNLSAEGCAIMTPQGALQEIDAQARVIRELRAALTDIDETCQQGLNSPTAKHWEAALIDCMKLSSQALKRGAK